MSRLSRFAACLLLAPVLPAQTPSANNSCEVHPDRTVTFRLRAPEATDVKITGDFVQGPLAMEKAEDGTWSITSVPLNPAIYSYNFRINGVSVLDPVNPMIQLGERMSASMFEVPADKPAPYDMQAVPHGTVHVNWYESKTLNAWRRIDVYTPPGYETGKAAYPVLYLLHGSGDTEAGWVAIGRANLIMDNLIAAGSARPMIVVMPYGRPRQDVYLGPAAPMPQPAGPKAFENDLLNDVIPFAEKLYRISAKPDDRAIAGLSMGGEQALTVGLNHLDIFHTVGAFSAGGLFRPQIEEKYKDLLADSAAANKKLKFFYIACGKADRLFEGSQALHDALAKHEIRHTFIASEEGHVWRNWRGYLADFVPQLFR